MPTGNSSKAKTPEEWYEAFKAELDKYHWYEFSDAYIEALKAARRVAGLDG